MAMKAGYMWRHNIPLDPPSKGEFGTTLRGVLGKRIKSGSEQVTLYVPTTIVRQISPFEGGSRGMFLWWRRVPAEASATLGSSTKEDSGHE
jgi:hypothetical protein